MFRYLIIFLGLLLLAACGENPVFEQDNPFIDEEFTECINGFAMEFPCDNVGLYAKLTPEELLAEERDNLPARLNDIWGWIDPQTGKEYALVGLSDGISIVDVTIPWKPVVMAKIAEIQGAKAMGSSVPELANHDDGGGFKEASVWRDLKVYENYLYVVTEQDHGMQVFDLTRIRDITDPPVIFQEDYHYTLFHNAHNIAINEETGYAYVVGSTRGQVCAERGGLHMIRLHHNPLQPEFAGCYFEEEAGGSTRNGYIHDTQCVIYTGPDNQHTGREICFSSSEKTFTITDVTDKENAFTIFNDTYPNNSYSHQGWLTEDHRYFFMNDELDEMQTGNNTRTYVWDVQNLENAEMIGYYEHDTRAVDHNLYIKGDLMYQANYTAGLRVLDVSNPLPEFVHTTGYFNTTPDNDAVQFAGVWSVFPYLSHYTVLASDIHNGLFILRVKR